MDSLTVMEVTGKEYTDLLNYVMSVSRNDLEGMIVDLYFDNMRLRGELDNANQVIR